MAETPQSQMPPDPQNQSEIFLDNFQTSIAYATRGVGALADERTPEIIINEATPPHRTTEATLLGMLLKREDLIDEIASRETDPTSARDQLSRLQQDIYAMKKDCGIDVVEPPLESLE